MHSVMQSGAIRRNQADPGALWRQWRLERMRSLRHGLIHAFHPRRDALYLMREGGRRRSSEAIRGH